MTNAKNEKKETATRSKDEERCQEELRIACEIHTLSQLLCNELAMTTPWVTPTWPPSGLQSSMLWPPTAPEAFGPMWPAPVRGPW
jgi:hypothetical protein